jgi:hypothetical protein
MDEDKSAFWVENPGPLIVCIEQSGDSPERREDQNLYVGSGAPSGFCARTCGAPTGCAQVARRVSPRKDPENLADFRVTYVLTNPYPWVNGGLLGLNTDFINAPLAVSLIGGSYNYISLTHQCKLATRRELQEVHIEAAGITQREVAVDPGSQGRGLWFTQVRLTERVTN